MGDLSKELLKAGLISKKQMKAAEHEKRVTRKKVGHKELEKKEKRKQEEYKQRKSEQQEKDRARNLSEKSATEEKVTRARLKDTVKNSAVKSGTGGNRKFYFITREGKIPYLEVNEETIRALKFGDLAIIQVPDVKQEQFVLLPKRTAIKVKEIEPDLVILFR